MTRWQFVVVVLTVLAGAYVAPHLNIPAAHAQQGVLAVQSLMPALSNPLSDLQNTTVSCGATGDPELIAPSGASSICVQNTSTTCVHLGGSTVTTTTGLAIGDGCAGGQIFCADAKRMWCESASGSIDVEVVWGST